MCAVGMLTLLVVFNSTIGHAECRGNLALMCAWTSVIAQKIWSSCFHTCSVVEIWVRMASNVCAQLMH